MGRLRHSQNLITNISMVLPIWQNQGNRQIRTIARRNNNIARRDSRSEIKTALAYRTPSYKVRWPDANSPQSCLLQGQHNWGVRQPLTWLVAVSHPPAIGRRVGRWESLLQGQDSTIYTSAPPLGGTASTGIALGGSRSGLRRFDSSLACVSGGVAPTAPPSPFKPTYG